MYIKVIDFVLLMVAVYIATIWGDGNEYHSFIVMMLIAASSIVAYIHGILIGLK